MYIHFTILHSTSAGAAAAAAEEEYTGSSSLIIRFSKKLMASCHGKRKGKEEAHEIHCSFSMRSIYMQYAMVYFYRHSWKQENQNEIRVLAVLLNTCSLSEQRVSVRPRRHQSPLKSSGSRGFGFSPCSYFCMNKP